MVNVRSCISVFHTHTINIVRCVLIGWRRVTHCSMYPDAWPVSARWVSSMIFDSHCYRQPIQLHQQRCSMAIFHGTVDQAGGPVVFVSAQAVHCHIEPACNKCMCDLLCRCCCQIPCGPRDVAEVEYCWRAYSSHMRLHRHFSIKLDTKITNTMAKQSHTRRAYSLIFFSCWAETNTTLLLLLSRSTSRSLFSSLSWFLCHRRKHVTSSCCSE